MKMKLSKKQWSVMTESIREAKRARAEFNSALKALRSASEECGFCEYDRDGLIDLVFRQGSEKPDELLIQFADKED